MAKKEGNYNDSTKTSAQGVRKVTRTGMYVATYTKYLGAFETIGEAKEAREKFIAKVTPPKPEKSEKKAKQPRAEKKTAKKAANGKPKSEQYKDSDVPIAATA